MPENNQLTRIDYCLVGTTQTNCLQILPHPSHIDAHNNNNNRAEVQKVAVANNEGILQVFSIKKEDMQLHFKSLPGPQISCLRYNIHNDRIYAACGTQIKTYSSKGKLMQTIDSGMTEAITCMYVLENDLFICSNHIYNHHRDGKDIGTYLCGDTIVDVVAFYKKNSTRQITLLACEGRMIRALEHCRVTFSIEIESSPSLIYIAEQDSDNSVKTIVLFGTVDGSVGIIETNKNHQFERWLIEGSNAANSTITALQYYHLFDSSNKYLVVGQCDGLIQVFLVDLAEANDSPILIYKHTCNESITSLQCGIVGYQGCKEILVSTYTGRIFGLTTATVQQHVNSANAVNFSQDTKSKITRLKAEIEDLQLKVAKEREKYHLAAQTTENEVSAIALVDINDSFSLSKDGTVYTLVLELPIAIDNVLLQCNIPVQMLDVEGNSAVVSYSATSAAEGNALLATYRCQSNTNRLQIKFAIYEGQCGLVQAYITPAVQPRCSRLKQYHIKPLSQHIRLQNLSSVDNRLANQLTLKGAFSLAEAHTWIRQCLPEVPQRPVQDPVTKECVLFFRLPLCASILKCAYQKGEANFFSDNITTISILKEFISNEATRKNIKIDINISVDDESIEKMLKTFEEQLYTYRRIKDDFLTLEALDEANIKVEDKENVCSDFALILDRHKEIRASYRDIKDKMLCIHGIIGRLYSSYHELRFGGRTSGRTNVDVQTTPSSMSSSSQQTSHNLEQLYNNLAHYDGTESLLRIFRLPATNTPNNPLINAN